MSLKIIKWILFFVPLSLLAWNFVGHRVFYRQQSGFAISSSDGQFDGAISIESQPDSAAYVTIDILIQLVNVGLNTHLMQNFRRFLTSLYAHTDAEIHLHLTVDDLGDRLSKSILQELIMKRVVRQYPRVSYYDISNVSKVLEKITVPLKDLFSADSKSYYGQSLFFVPIALHRFLPASVTRIMMFDVDVEFRADVRILFDMFDEMNDTAIMALAYEQQPVYWHLTWEYRSNHENTTVGNPPPSGMPGFNSGTKLVSLSAMRLSSLYNSYIDNPLLVATLAGKFKFRGHLGDQDFFTLLSFEHPELFYVLPCQWNRQLCTWWRDKGGYSDAEFNRFFHCPPPIFLYHGNCNTPIHVR